MRAVACARTLAWPRSSSVGTTAAPPHLPSAPTHLPPGHPASLSSRPSQGAGYLKEQLPGAHTAIGENVKAVQAVFKGIFNIGDDELPADGSAFDMLLADGQEVPLGDLTIRVLHTPGHTPACVCLHVGDAVFTGDTVFMPDFGSARCDFPGGSATDIYRSITTKLFTLPDETRVFVGHDYPPEGRGVEFETTVAAQKSSNKHLGGGVAEADFVKMRSERDATLNPPKLLLASLQVNLRNGQLPPPESNGTSYLKVPLNVI